MFEELLSILPYNPSLINQISFYGRRMRGERNIRRLGLLFIILAFTVQFFAVMNPAQPTLAYSTNDLVNGGFNSAAEAASICRANVNNYGTILQNYGITCNHVASAPTVTIHSTDFNRQLFSMGRLPYGLAGETPVNIAGSIYYVRYLWSWDTGAPSTYQALNVTSTGGQTFFLLFACGNLTSVGLPVPVAPPKAPTPKAPVQPTKAAPPQMCQYDTALPANSSQCVPCEYNNSITSSNSQCKPCQASLSSQDTIACIAIHKTAANLTQGISNANNTTAQPGNVILYTLYAYNQGKGTVNNYVFQEQLSSVLDYANIQNLYGGSLNNSTDQVVWPAVTITPGQTATVKVAVQVKSVIPQTPTSSSNPGAFNLVMTNVYGNTININVPGSPAKTIEMTAAKLPNTGPGSSLFIGALVIVIAGYFFARSKLLAAEINIAVQENISGGL